MTNSRVNQVGISLFELLIGLAIGTFLLGGLAAHFVQSKFTFATQQAQAIQHSSDRMSTQVLVTALQQAGFAPMDPSHILNPLASFPADPPFDAGQRMLGTQASANVAVLGSAGTISYPSDRVTVRYWGDIGIVDCIGEPVPSGFLHVDEFYSDGEHLLCERNGGSPIVILGDTQVGVRAQQLRVLGIAVTYGLDSDFDGGVDTYRRAMGVTDWTRVKSVNAEVFTQSGTRQPSALSIGIALENMRGDN